MRWTRRLLARWITIPITVLLSVPMGVPAVYAWQPTSQLSPVLAQNVAGFGVAAIQELIDAQILKWDPEQIEKMGVPELERLFGEHATIEYPIDLFEAGNPDADLSALIPLRYLLKLIKAKAEQLHISLDEARDLIPTQFVLYVPDVPATASPEEKAALINKRIAAARDQVLKYSASKFPEAQKNSKESVFDLDLIVFADVTSGSGHERLATLEAVARAQAPAQAEAKVAIDTSMITDDAIAAQHDPGLADMLRGVREKTVTPDELIQTAQDGGSRRSPEETMEALYWAGIVEQQQIVAERAAEEERGTAGTVNRRRFLGMTVGAVGVVAAGGVLELGQAAAPHLPEASANHEEFFGTLFGKYAGMFNGTVRYSRGDTRDPRVRPLRPGVSDGEAALIYKLMLPAAQEFLHRLKEHQDLAYAIDFFIRTYGYVSIENGRPVARFDHGISKLPLELRDPLDSNDYAFLWNAISITLLKVNTNSRDFDTTTINLLNSSAFLRNRLDYLVRNFAFNEGGQAVFNGEAIPRGQPPVNGEGIAAFDYGRTVRQLAADVALSRRLSGHLEIEQRAVLTVLEGLIRHARPNGLVGPTPRSGPLTVPQLLAAFGALASQGPFSRELTRVGSEPLRANLFDLFSFAAARLTRTTGWGVRPADDPKAPALSISEFAQGFAELITLPQIGEAFVSARTEEERFILVNRVLFAASFLLQENGRWVGRTADRTAPLSLPQLDEAFAQVIQMPDVWLAIQQAKTPAALALVFRQAFFATDRVRVVEQNGRVTLFGEPFSTKMPLPLPELNEAFRRARALPTLTELLTGTDEQVADNYRRFIYTALHDVRRGDPTLPDPTGPNGHEDRNGWYEERLPEDKRWPSLTLAELEEVLNLLVRPGTRSLTRVRYLGPATPREQQLATAGVAVAAIAGVSTAAIVAGQEPAPAATLAATPEPEPGARFSRRRFLKGAAKGAAGVAGLAVTGGATELLTQVAAPTPAAAQGVTAGLAATAFATRVLTQTLDLPALSRGEGRLLRSAPARRGFPLAGPLTERRDALVTELLSRPAGVAAADWQRVLDFWNDTTPAQLALRDWLEGWLRAWVSPDGQALDRGRLVVVRDAQGRPVPDAQGRPIPLLDAQGDAQYEPTQDSWTLEAYARAWATVLPGILALPAAAQAVLAQTRDPQQPGQRLAKDALDFFLRTHLVPGTASELGAPVLETATGGLVTRTTYLAGLGFFLSPGSEVGNLLLSAPTREAQLGVFQLLFVATSRLRPDPARQNEQVYQEPAATDALPFKALDAAVADLNAETALAQLIRAAITPAQQHRLFNTLYLLTVFLAPTTAPTTGPWRVRPGAPAEPWVRPTLPQLTGALAQLAALPAVVAELATTEVVDEKLSQQRFLELLRQVFAVNAWLVRHADGQIVVEPFKLDQAGQPIPAKALTPVRSLPVAEFNSLFAALHARLPTGAQAYDHLLRQVSQWQDDAQRDRKFAILFTATHNVRRGDPALPDPSTPTGKEDPTAWYEEAPTEGTRWPSLTLEEIEQVLDLLDKAGIQRLGPDGTHGHPRKLGPSRPPRAVQQAAGLGGTPARVAAVGAQGGRDFGMLPSGIRPMTHAAQDAFFDGFLARVYAGPVMGVRREVVTNVAEPSLDLVGAFLNERSWSRELDQGQLDETPLSVLLNQLVHGELPNGPAGHPPALTRIYVTDRRVLPRRLQQAIRDSEAKLGRPLQVFAHESDRGIHLFILGHEPLAPEEEAAVIVHALMAFMGASNITSLAAEALFRIWHRKTYDPRVHPDYYLSSRNSEIVTEFRRRVAIEEGEQVASTVDYVKAYDSFWDIGRRLDSAKGQRDPALLTKLGDARDFAMGGAPEDIAVNETEARSTSEFLTTLRRRMTLSPGQLDAIGEDFDGEQARGWRGETSSLRSLVSDVPVPTGEEKGQVIAFDFGGTHLRLVLVDLHGDHKMTVHADKEQDISLLELLGVSSEQEAEQLTMTKEELFRRVARFIKRYRDAYGITEPIDLGFIFSYPVNAEGKIEEVTKLLVSFRDLIGQDPQVLLNRMLDEEGVTNIRVTDRVNDTVATAVGGRYENPNVRNGFVGSTGTNQTAEVPREALTKLGPPEPGEPETRYVNYETGNYDLARVRGIRTKYDVPVDRAVVYGKQRAEKLISALYLPRILHEIVRDRQSDSNLFQSPEWTAALERMEAKHMSAIINQDAGVWAELGLSQTPSDEEVDFLRQVSIMLGHRSAQIAAIMEARTIRATWGDRSQRYGIAADSTLYTGFPGWREAFHETLRQQFGADADRVEVRPTDHASARGVAVITAGAAMRKAQRAADAQRVEAVSRNIELTSQLIEQGQTPHMIGIVSGTAQEFWQAHLDRSKESLKVGEAISYVEPRRLNQALGMMFLWQQLRTQIRRDQGSLIAFVFGDGTRSTPFTETDSGQKPAIATFVTVTEPDGSVRYVPMVELAIRHFVPVQQYLWRSGFRGLVVKWGDEVLIPSIDLTASDPRYAGADIVRFVAKEKMTADTAKNKDWIAVDPEGRVAGLIPRRPTDEEDPLAAMGQLADQGLIERREGDLYGWINVGSIGISYRLQDALLEEFKTEVNDPEGKRSERPQLDPEFSAALAIAAIPDAQERQRAWDAELARGGRVAMLNTWIPNVLPRMRRVIESLDSPLKMVAMDFGEPYWGDIGQHPKIEEFYQSLKSPGSDGQIARKIGGLPDARDANGNIIVNSTISPRVTVRNSVLINAQLFGSGVVQDSVLIGTRTGDIEARQATDVLSTAVSLRLRSGSVTYKVVSDQPIEAGEGERVTTLFLPEPLPDGRSQIHMRFNVGTDPEHPADPATAQNYREPILGNPISSADAHQRMSRQPLVALEKARGAAERAVAQALRLTAIGGLGVEPQPGAIVGTGVNLATESAGRIRLQLQQLAEVVNAVRAATPLAVGARQEIFNEGGVRVDAYHAGPTQEKEIHPETGEVTIVT